MVYDILEEIIFGETDPEEVILATNDEVFIRAAAIFKEAGVPTTVLGFNSAPAALKEAGTGFTVIPSNLIVDRYIKY